VIRALVSGDSERFYAEETAQREMAVLPPFGRLAALIVSADDRNPGLKPRKDAGANGRTTPRRPRFRTGRGTFGRYSWPSPIPPLG